MYPPIFMYANRSAQVRALLGGVPLRFYMFGEAPHSPTYPYAVWQTVGGAPENYITNAPNIDRFGVQVDVYATSSSEARECVAALRDALEPYAHITGWSGESRDGETGSYRSGFEMDWWTHR